MHKCRMLSLHFGYQFPIAIFRDAAYISALCLFSDPVQLCIVFTYIEDLTLVVISCEIYETSLRRVS